MSEYCAVFSSYSWQRVIIFRWGIGPKKSTSVALHGFVISLGWPHVTPSFRSIVYPEFHRPYPFATSSYNLTSFALSTLSFQLRIGVFGMLGEVKGR
jgi:hypothetical protein